VRLQVGSQVGPVGEGAAALRAGKRSLAGVGPQVPLKQPRPRERLAAQLAATRQRVRPDVHLERAERRVRLAAVTTRQLPVSDDFVGGRGSGGYRGGSARRRRSSLAATLR